jgi:hypothetical protein
MYAGLVAFRGRPGYRAHGVESVVRGMRESKFAINLLTLTVLWTETHLPMLIRFLLDLDVSVRVRE